MPRQKPTILLVPKHHHQASMAPTNDKTPFKSPAFTFVRCPSDQIFPTKLLVSSFRSVCPVFYHLCCNYITPIFDVVPRIQRVLPRRDTDNTDIPRYWAINKHKPNTFWVSVLFPSRFEEKKGKQKVLEALFGKDLRCRAACIQWPTSTGEAPSSVQGSRRTNTAIHPKLAAPTLCRWRGNLWESSPVFCVYMKHSWGFCRWVREWLETKERRSMRATRRAGICRDVWVLDETQHESSFLSFCGLKVY